MNDRGFDQSGVKQSELDLSASKAHTERSTPKNVRYINYKLLSGVEFSGEPVVPKILREGQDELGGFFKVEELQGEDLADLLRDQSLGAKVKMEVVLHVVKQLQSIDQAGFVLFDRNADNIRIISMNKRISTRQMDIEDMYDKDTDAVYSLSQSKYEDMIQRLKKMGIDIWLPSVNRFAQNVCSLLNEPAPARAIISSYTDIRIMPTKKDVLGDFSDALSKAIEALHE